MNSSIIGRHATALLLLGLILVFSGCKKEEGCTDPAAINYNPEAEKDDGSCTYSEEIVIADDGSGTGTTTWSSDNVYILDGFVFVNPGQTLTIEPGTVIKGRGWHRGQRIRADRIAWSDHHCGGNRYRSDYFYRRGR